MNWITNFDVRRFGFTWYSLSFGVYWNVCWMQWIRTGWHNIVLLLIRHHWSVIPLNHDRNVNSFENIVDMKTDPLSDRKFSKQFRPTVDSVNDSDVLFPPLCITFPPSTYELDTISVHKLGNCYSYGHHIMLYHILVLSLISFNFSIIYLIISWLVAW